MVMLLEPGIRAVAGPTVVVTGCSSTGSQGGPPRRWAGAGRGGGAVVAMRWCGGPGECGGYPGTEIRAGWPHSGSAGPGRADG
ncbi:hypothetical protein GCM10025734_43780 [Kitasatospora paranensis]